MAPFKVPRSLRDLALAQVACNIWNTCSGIVLANPASQPDRLTAAVALGDFLRSRIWPLFEEINVFVFTEGVLVEPVYGCIVQPSRTFTLQRRLNDGHDVMLHVFVHPEMRTLHIRSEKICASHFSRLQGLIKLDLGCLVSLPEQTMKAIVTNCRQLEVIAFNFRVTTLHAIGQLKVVKTLRVIRDTGLECIFDGQKYYLDLLRTLLKELPKLEHITCRFIGAVLDGLDQDQPLSLRNTIEKDPGQDLEAIARLCPELELLTLGADSQMETLLSCSFAPITESTIKISYLVISCFRFTKTIEDFILVKGIHLKAIFLRDSYDLSVENVKVIGRSCRFLETLIVSLYDGVDEVPLYHYNPHDTSEVMFENLQDFACDGLGLLHLCLTHAKNIKSVVITWEHLTLTDEPEVLNAFSDLIAVNPLTSLTYLKLYASYIVMSTRIIRYFYDLPNIAKISIAYLKFDPEIIKLVIELNKEIVDNNVNLQFECDFYRNL